MRRVNTVKALVDEYGLALDITLVRSQCNRTNGLTRVSQKWFRKANECEKPIVAVRGSTIESLSDERIARIHKETGHHIMILSGRCTSRER